MLAPRIDRAANAHEYAGSSPMKDSAQPIETRQEKLSDLRRYLNVPSVFETDTMLHVVASTKGVDLIEHRLDRTFRKDYDSVDDPMKWPARFDMSNWIFVGAYMADERLGGAIGAYSSPALDLLAKTRDCVLIWDLRVSPQSHRRGVGSALFKAIESRGRDCGCRELRVETQNFNVAACRFYAAQGCELTQANFGAYAQMPEEVQLIWSKKLDL
jgi:streptothricin acetyltransferase